MKIVHIYTEEPMDKAQYPSRDSFLKAVLQASVLVTKLRARRDDYESGMIDEDEFQKLRREIVSTVENEGLIDAVLQIMETRWVVSD